MLEMPNTGNRRKKNVCNPLEIRIAREIGKSLRLDCDEFDLIHSTEVIAFV